MLNCTDLACVLHHHHFYAHLHHLKHHLQDENDGTSLGDGSDVDNNDNTQGVSNETDAPNDVIYMVCGVVIAMLLVGVIIVLVAITINKLRKREETSSASPATVEAQPTNFGPHSRSSSSGSNCSSQHYHRSQPRTAATTNSLVESNNAANLAYSNTANHQHQPAQQVSFTRTSGGGGGGGGDGVNGVNGGSNCGVVTNDWVFPPKAPTPNIYNCNNNFDALIAANDKNGFKGFRKQFSGRFKRLVAKKPHEPAPAIPPELKPQLKTIYVY